MNHMGIESLYIFVHSYHKRVGAYSGLNLDLGNFDLVYAQSTKLVEFGTQQSLRKEVGDVALSSNELDCQLAVFDVATMLEESHLHVLVFAWRLRVIRIEDRS